MTELTKPLTRVVQGPEGGRVVVELRPEGVNDRGSDARELAAVCRRLRPAAHVNLIPLNPTPGYPTRGSSLKRVHEFRDELERLGANATVRQNRGTDIDAACGQLAAGQPVSLVANSRRRGPIGTG